MKQQEIDRLARSVTQGVRVRDVRTIEGKVEHLAKLVERLAQAIQALNAKLR